MGIVTLKSETDTAIRGVMWSQRGPWLVLRQAEMLRPNAAPGHMDGEVLVHRDNVAFIQVP